MGMAIERGIAEVELIALHDFTGTVPADEGSINGLTFGVIANGAFTAVTFEIGRGSGMEGFALGEREILNSLGHLSST